VWQSWDVWPRSEKAQQMARSKSLILGAILLALLVGATTWYLLSRDPCAPLIPIRDSRAVSNAEERELLNALLAERRSQLTFPKQFRGPILPLPTRVTVSGYVATVRAASPMPPYNYLYAVAWYNVYHRYHGGNRCVRLRVAWRSGSSELEAPPALTM